MGETETLRSYSRVHRPVVGEPDCGWYSQAGPSSSTGMPR